ncbi:hypothetical protein P153DRAFT_158997 [Dothidotthia symphoricarpi CBS 119687]|uniref:Uncharacterized protein n=1 Tax=Dothidotthia symphoricarpi CBS 119687 TaxID=1392245 RepID=A0A6A6ANQ8_9PLEO|nr:uncharacterized protein P153DRAFT_158997 [Dothidotthia symphoricarpi CBS 119687]KAF2133549.1 hypothetical protein P153DRAFT_158997 [Dothidotthia symphoricarpi CBS 119687]
MTGVGRRTQGGNCCHWLRGGKRYRISSRLALSSLSQTRIPSDGRASGSKSRPVRRGNELAEIEPCPWFALVCYSSWPSVFPLCSLLAPLVRILIGRSALCFLSSTRHRSACALSLVQSLFPTIYAP